MRVRVHMALVLSLTGLLQLPACRAFDDFFSSSLPGGDAFTFDVPGDLPEVDLTTGQGVGDPCTSLGGGTSDCRLTLVCDDGECKAAGTTGPGQFCVLSAECAPGHFCGFAGVCQPGGAGGNGAVCTTAADCLDGLYCRIFGLSGVCEPAGAGDLGDACEATGECFAGLACTDGACQATNITEGLAVWTGRTCAATDDGPPRALFELPRGDEHEFYRLPHPNDARVVGGTVDLSGFPTPGPGAIGFDPVQRLIDGAAAVQTGYSLVPTVTLRFSAQIDADTVNGNASAGTQTLRFVDITPGNPGYGSGPAYSWSYDPARGRYICSHHMTVQPAWHSPLRPGSTYAVYLSKGVRTPDTADGVTDTPGTFLAADDDFLLLMADAAPADPVELAAWNAYGPLRVFLDEQGIARDSVLTAAVFSTEPTHELLPAVRAAVHAAELPAPQSLTLCDGAAASPCDDGLTDDAHHRGCPAVVDDRVHELHLKVALPRVQAGSRPHLEPADGGGLVVSVDGEVALQGTDDVCVSLTIPKGPTMPEQGWPLMVFGHGTGGTFQSAVSQAGLPLADVTTASGARVGVAVAGWDGPMHADRRGGLDIAPEPLFYHYGNPVAARGNVYQGAADVFALVRALAAVDLPAEESPTGQALRFDLDHVAYGGHSQGATTGQLAVPFEPDVGLTVWSGAGAGLRLSMLDKTSPVDAEQGLAVALQEVGTEGALDIASDHPVLAIIEDLFGVVDPLTYARLQLLDPVQGVGAQHVLHVQGLGDTFTPPSTIRVLARLSGVDLVEPELEPIEGVGLLTAPMSGNVKSGGQFVTGALIQASPAEGSDGHFVMFTDPAVTDQFARFVATWVADGMPAVVPRGE